MSDDSKSGGYQETKYDTVDKVVSTNSIPHHWAVETAAEGEAAGRHSYPLVGTIGN